MHIHNERKGNFLYVLGDFGGFFFFSGTKKIEDVKHTAIKQAISANISMGIAFF